MKPLQSRRLPFVSAVASLCSSAVVARAPLVIYPLKTRHHDATTTPQPTIPLQPVCYHAADDYHNPYLYHSQSAAITLQTTTATPTFTTTSLLLSRYRRLPQPLPLPQPVCCCHAADDYRNPYLYHNQSAAITLQTTIATPTFTTTSLLSRCRRLSQPLPLPQPVCYHAADDHCNPYLYYNQSAAIKLRTTTATPTFTATSLQLSRCRKPPHHRRTAGVPRAHCRRTAGAPQTHRRRRHPIPQYYKYHKYHNTTIPIHRRRTASYRDTDNHHTI